jgi:hypothetical protein
MPDLAFHPPTLEAPRLSRRPLLLVCLVSAALVAVTLVLWANYGTAVFFEIIAAGLAACF